MPTVLPKGVSHRLACQVCFVITALLGLGLGGCEKDPQEESIARQIIGEYYLSRVTGGIAGVNETYTPQTSPTSWRFDNGGRYYRVTRPAATGAPDVSEGSWFMTNVSRVGDTLAFTLLLRDTDGRDENRDYYLIGNRQLQNQPECCDQFNQTYLKQPGR